MTKNLLLCFAVLFPARYVFSQVNCDLTYLTTIENFTVYTHNPSGAILYRAKLVVDADGSPRAYGPNNSGLDWTANAGYPGNWWGIVTDSNGDPVIQGSGDPYPGMYVSTTSLIQYGYATTNPLRYVNSETVPYIALPSALQSLANISKGDFAYVRNTLNGDSSFAYFADSGPAGKLGEGSMLLASRLGLNNSPKYGGTSQPVIDYVVFPQSGFGQGTQLTAAEIDSIGEEVLNAAGGFGLPGCLDTQIPPLDCEHTIPLSCGVTYNGTSSIAQSLVGAYGCNTWTETGPERVHSIIPSGNGTITATVSNYTGDLDVYILGGCDPANCLGTVSSSSASFVNAIAGETYYIVVDADDGSASAYSLAVTCPASTGTEDISLSGAFLSAGQVSAGDTISVSVTHSYNGATVDSLLPAFDLDYFLSTDCNLSPDDTLIGSDDSELGSDAPSANEGATLIIPSNTATGNYFILFVADNGDALAESNEGNNIECIPVTIDPLVLDCYNAVQLTCGVSFHGASSTAVSNVGTYGCNTWTETGPERVHSLVPQANGTITAAISNFTGDLDVFILSSCDPLDCKGTVSSSSASFNNALAGVTYYIIVDADDGSGSAYDLLVTCPALPDPDDIAVSYTSVSDSIASTGDSIIVFSTQLYYGSQPDSTLPSFGLNYYLSADCILSADDTLLGMDESEIGEDFPSENETDTLVLPTNLFPGSYFILFVADSDNELAEANDSNNTLCMQISISCAGPATATDVISACGQYTWIDGITYFNSTDSAVYTISGGAVNGCDSVITLHLTINENPVSTDIQNACDSFQWIDGNIYYSDNSTATFIIGGGAANGCDSVVTLDLNINTVETDVSQIGNTLSAVTANAAYQWHICDSLFSGIPGEINQTIVISADGSYAVEITENGCSAISGCYNVTGLIIYESSVPKSIKLYKDQYGNYLIHTSDRDLQIAIRNVLGQTVAVPQYISGNKISVHFPEGNGIYLFEISNSVGESKFIKVLNFE